jgi:hypothetical protein
MVSMNFSKSTGFLDVGGSRPAVAVEHVLTLVGGREDHDRQEHDP